MPQRIITLTGRPPVKIDEEDWNVIASANDSEHDGQVECQANRKSNWSIRVRQKCTGDDTGKDVYIVSAVYSYSSNWQGERNYQAKRGVIVTGDAQAVCDAIREVAEQMAEAEHDGEDASRWPTLAAECIADMPAESI